MHLYRFDCGSGTGKVRSDETILLNQWNSITVYRHRWDAWIQLNEGNRVQGRSKVTTQIHRHHIMYSHEIISVFITSHHGEQVNSIFHIIIRKEKTDEYGPRNSAYTIRIMTMQFAMIGPGLYFIYEYQEVL